jgi:fatty acid desaturase
MAENGPIIDMTPEGEFIQPPRPNKWLVFLARLALFGLALVLIAMMFWAAVILIPLLLLAGLVGAVFFMPSPWRPFGR